MENKFQTMPLRFRVWDSHRHIFVHWDENYCFARDEDDRIYLSNIDWGSKDLPEEDNNRFVISQDTGLEDKHGKSIFTGDIVKLPSRIGRKYEVVRYSLPCAGVVPCVRGCLDCPNPMVTEIEVVGNVWQDPDLLEKIEKEK